MKPDPTLVAFLDAPGAKLVALVDGERTVITGMRALRVRQILRDLRRAVAHPSTPTEN